MARAAALLTDEKTRKGLGWVVAAVLSPLILVVAALCVLGSGAAGHNISAVQMCFEDGPLPDDLPEEYRVCVEATRENFAEIDAAIYVLDCLPNLTNKSADEARDLAIAAVEQLRKTTDAPIILVEHAGYSNAPTNAAQLDCYTRLNRGQREAYETLKNKGVKDLHYISHDELAYPADAWVDYVHPSDLGAQRQADIVTARIREIKKF